MELFECMITDSHAGERLDRYLAGALDLRSRSDIQRDIRRGLVAVNGRIITQPAFRLPRGARVVWTIDPRPLLLPRPARFSVIHEDDEIVVVDKPAGLVVHPGAGTEAPTLVEGLLTERQLPRIDDPRRPGIVHRLDAETSGVLVVAKTPSAAATLARQFAERSVVKLYIAVVEGQILEDEGRIDAPIGRDPVRPTRMAIQAGGRPARTEFRVLRREASESLLLVQPETGRTHQIRLHLRYIGHPVRGDAVYGDAGSAPRLLLHAWRLSFHHPEDGRWLRVSAPLPAEFPPHPYEPLPWSLHPECA